MATYEGKWRCLRCSSANSGRHLNCQSCGVKRDENVVFFLDDDAAAVTNTSLINQASAGADWICQYCAGHNRAFDARCSSCGNTRGTQDRQLHEETRGVNDWSEQAQNFAQNAGQQYQPPQADTPKTPSFIGRLVKFGLLGVAGIVSLVIVLFCILIYLSTLTYPTEIEVTGLEWKRSIALEEYKTVTETAWEGEVPNLGRIQSSERALHHNNRVSDGTRQVPETYTEQVADGSERYVCGRINKKNGYFEDKYCTRTKYKSVTKTRNRTETVYRDVPVYKTRYTYLIDKWVSIGEKETSGTDFNPQWAIVNVDNVHTREAGRKENYNLLCQELSGNNKLHKIPLTADNWQKFHNGDHLHGKTDYFGKLVSIDELPDGKW